MKTKIVYFFFLLAIIYAGCSRNADNATSNIRKIKPPLPKADIRFDNYSVDATEGAIIKHKTGSLIKIPANTFVDKNGKQITGKVEIKYREMHSPSEIFVSGIPMTYDSAGVEYHFESAGMNEIQAVQNNQPVFISNDKTIDICLKSKKSASKFNLYFYDTIQNQWINQGKDIRVAINADSIEEPVKPVELNGERYSFSINVNYIEFPELMVFQNTTFQLTDSVRIDTSDINTLWHDVKISKGKKKGTYNVEFGGYSEKASYEVIPVYDKMSIGKAIKYYEQKFAAYKNLLLTKIETEKKNNENQKILEQKKMFDLVEKFKKEDNMLKILELQKENNQKKIKEYQKTLFKNEEAKMKNLDAVTQVNTAIYRTFSIKNFGLYNCDCPYSLPQGAMIAAKFSDQDGNSIELNKLVLIELSSNKMFNYYMGTFNNFKFDPKQKNMLCASTTKGQFVYYTADDFKDVVTTGEFTFRMRLSTKEINSFEDIDEELALN